MVNKLAYKPRVKDILDKYCDNSPNSPDHSDQDSDSVQMGELDWEENGVRVGEWGGVSCVLERNQSVIY